MLKRVMRLDVLVACFYMHARHVVLRLDAKGHQELSGSLAAQLGGSSLAVVAWQRRQQGGGDSAAAAACKSKSRNCECNIRNGDTMHV